MMGGESMGEQNNPESEPGATMRRTNHIPRIRHFLSLPQERNRNCAEPVKGQARWRGSLRSPLTEPSQFQSTPPTWKRKKKTESSAPSRHSATRSQI